ncbi:MAG: DUF4834 family protein [Pyrinomonadaceae bacterium]|nr:DUF4834 family protein [Sphingobacteriaceae bacterium]
MTLLKFLLISILVLWLIRMIARLLLPVLFKKMVNKAQEHVNKQSGQQRQQSRPVGKIHVDYVPPKDKEARAADKAGDFIDFEEVK